MLVNKILWKHLTGKLTIAKFLTCINVSDQSTIICLYQNKIDNYSSGESCVKSQAPSAKPENIFSVKFFVRPKCNFVMGAIQGIVSLIEGEED